MKVIAILTVAVLTLVASCANGHSAGGGKPDPHAVLHAATWEPLEVYPLGEIAEYGNGFAATITDVRELEIARPPRFDSDPMVRHLDRYAQATLKLTNNSTVPFELATIALAADSAERFANILYPEESGLDPWPAGTLSPGATAAFTFGIGLLDPENVTIQLRLPLTDDDQFEAIFASSKAFARSAEPGPGTAGEGNTAQFGQYLTWDNGISIAVSEAKPFVPGGVAFVFDNEEAAHYLMFTVRVVNGSTGAFDALNVDVRAYQDGRELEGFVDLDNGLGIGPEVWLMQGGGAGQLEFGYGVARLDGITLEVRPTHDDDAGYFSD